MKKKLITVFAAFMLAASMLAGCGSSGSNGNGDGADTNANADVQKFVEEQQESVEQMSALLGDELDVIISAEDNAVVFTYQYNAEMTEEEKTQMKEGLENQMDAATEYFQESLTQLREEASEDAYIIIRYTAADGEELYSQDIK